MEERVGQAEMVTDTDESEEEATTTVTGRELPSEVIVVTTEEAEAPPPWPLRVVYGVVGLGLFVMSLGLMKAGADWLAPSLESSIFTDNALSTLGLGWLGACIVLSGSPVAAASLTLLDGGAITETESFTMLIGSRLGASFVVLVVGVLYALRNRGQGRRRAPVSIGVLSLMMTALVYLPAAVVGYWLLNRGVFDWVDISSDGGELTSLTDSLFGWATDAITDVAPGWALFPIGLGLLLLGFQAFDKVLPNLGAERLEEHETGWYTRKWPMFLAGCGVTTLTLSVSVALTLLVPLVAKQRLRRANTLPYIAGANITTLIDTLVAALVLGNPEGVQVVVAVTTAVTVWTLLLLATCYPFLRRVLLGLARRILANNRRLAAFAAGLFIIPIVLIAI